MKNKIYFIICAASFILTVLLALFTIEPAYMNTTGWDTYPIPEIGQSFIDFSKRVILSGSIIMTVQVIGLIALYRLNKVYKQ